MKTVRFCFLLLLSLNISCTQKENTPNNSSKTNKPVSQLSETAHPKIVVSEILKDFNSFWKYYNSHIELYKDFTGVNSKSEVITKKQFLEQMSSGLYFPLVISSKDTAIKYKLQKIPHQADKYISIYMKEFSINELVSYNMERKKFPKFSFVDLNGNKYTSENTMGKIIVLKCWFLACPPCVAEIPYLNQLVDQYKNRHDILFISLLLDQSKEMKQFFSKTRFDYVNIPDQRAYIKQKLHVKSYPTHFIINKQGILVRVLPNHIRIAEALAIEAAK